MELAVATTAPTVMITMINLATRATIAITIMTIIKASNGRNYNKNNNHISDETMNKHKSALQARALTGA